ncbi:hypothetical protein KKC13_07515 [bacterium]|nr:hypothetical protein [bacterium]MBU1957959.1 hypothetical protein [bacterium]
MFNKVALLSFFLLSTFSLHAVTISGKISYERIHPIHTGPTSTLNTSNITVEPAKEVQIEAINASGTSVASTHTDTGGNYSLSGLSENINVKIRVSAKMYKNNGWDVKVINNYNNDALYVVEGAYASTGSTNSLRNLTASSNDTGSAPFAILDSVHQAMQKILAVDSSVVFPALKMKWSINNIESGTYYDGTDNIMLQGDQNGDSDEYDHHIVIHEWGHYFENKLSRADNIGGQHGTGEHLDIRVAFGEGFGNALSAIVTDDPIYFDTYNTSGWNMNIESATHETPGWFSEASVQRILYDLYDSNNDGDDTLSLGFKPLYDVLIGAQKTTKAFTSLFSFVTELKNENSSSSDKIDGIVGSENIATIDDIYGSDRLNNVIDIVLPLYSEITVNETFKEVCTSTTYSIPNKLNNHKFVKFTIENQGTYPIRVEQNDGSISDPDFTLFKASPFGELASSTGTSSGIEEKSFSLDAGEYLLDISDSQHRSSACFNVTVGEVTSTGSSSSSSSVGIALPKNILLSLLFILSIAFLPAFLIRKEL